MIQTNKDRIKTCFSRNFETYHQQADVQRQVVAQFTQKLQDYWGSQARRTLELGCGTGFLTEQLDQQLPSSHLYINDLTAPYPPQIDQIVQKRSQDSYSFLPGDAEKIEFPEKLNAIVSTSTIQWFHHLDAFLAKSAQALAPGGLLAISTFGPLNFQELRTTLQIGLHYPTLSELQQKIGKHFDLLDSTIWPQHLVFENAYEVLRHIKQTGVNGLHQGYLGKSQLQAFCQRYENLFAQPEGGVRLTYQPIIIIAQKNSL